MKLDCFVLSKFDFIRFEILANFGSLLVTFFCLRFCLLFRGSRFPDDSCGIGGRLPKSRSALASKQGSTNQDAPRMDSV